MLVSLIQIQRGIVKIHFQEFLESKIQILKLVVQALSHMRLILMN